MKGRKLVIEGVGNKVKPNKAAKYPLIHVRCATCRVKLFSFEGDIFRLFDEEFHVDYQKAVRTILVEDSACLNCKEEEIYQRGHESGEQLGWTMAYDDMRERMDSTHDIKDKIKEAEEAVSMIQSSIKFTKELLVEFEEMKEDISKNPEEF